MDFENRDSDGWHAENRMKFLTREISPSQITHTLSGCIKHHTPILATPSLPDPFPLVGATFLRSFAPLSLTANLMHDHRCGTSSWSAGRDAARRNTRAQGLYAPPHVGIRRPKTIARDSDDSLAGQAQAR